MNDLERRRLAAQGRYNAAQQAEAEARTPIAQERAKAEAVAAQDELAAVEQETRRRVEEGRL